MFPEIMKANRAYARVLTFDGGEVLQVPCRGALGCPFRAFALLLSSAILVGCIDIIKRYERTFLHRLNPSQRTPSCCCSCCCCSSSGCCNSSSTRSVKSTRWKHFTGLDCCAWLHTLAGMITYLYSTAGIRSLSDDTYSPVIRYGILEPISRYPMISIQSMKSSPYPSLWH